MDEITRKHRTGEATYYVYSKEEADELGLQYVPWKWAKTGQMALTDDGFVAVCIKRRGPYMDNKGKRWRYELVFPFCTVFSNRKTLDYERYRAGDDETESWAAKELKKPRAIRAVELYAQLMLERKGKLTDTDWKTIGAIYRPDQEIPEATAKRFIRQAEVQRMVAQKIAQMLSDRGITPETVVDDYLDLKERAKKAKNLNIEKAVLDKFFDMLDMKPERQQKVRLDGMDVDWSVLAEVGEEPEELYDAPMLKAAPTEEEAGV